MLGISPLASYFLSDLSYTALNIKKGAHMGSFRLHQMGLILPHIMFHFK